jgi:hypothetical protein
MLTVHLTIDSEHRKWGGGVEKIREGRYKW